MGHEPPLDGCGVHVDRAMDGARHEVLDRDQLPLVIERAQDRGCMRQIALLGPAAQPPLEQAVADQVAHLIGRLDPRPHGG